MSTVMLGKLRSDALSLTETERAELAYALVKSLDAPDDLDANDAWDREIQRRLAQISAGTAKFMRRDEFQQRMKRRVSKG